jgi:hypothetical protein
MAKSKFLIIAIKSEKACPIDQDGTGFWFVPLY